MGRKKSPPQTIGPVLVLVLVDGRIVECAVVVDVSTTKLKLSIMLYVEKLERILLKRNEFSELSIHFDTLRRSASIIQYSSCSICLAVGASWALCWQQQHLLA